MAIPRTKTYDHLGGLVNVETDSGSVKDPESGIPVKQDIDDLKGKSKTLGEDVEALKEQIKNIGNGNYTEGKYLNAAGEMLSDASYGVTDFIPVTAGEFEWRYSASGALDTKYLILYNENKVKENADDYYSSFNGSGYRVITLESRYKYVRFTFKLSDIAVVYAKQNGVNIYTPVSGGLITNLEKRVTALEGGGGADGGILRFNKDEDTLPKLQAMTKPTYQGGYKSAPLVFAHFSDIHGTSPKRIIEFCAHHSIYIDNILNTGDSMGDGSVDFGGVVRDFGWYSNVSGVNKILSVIGNHDSAASGRKTTGGNWEYDWQGYGKVNTYNRFIAPFVANWGVVQPTNAASQGLNYYYKDYTDKGIRLICLDVMFYDAAQNTWLTNTLASAKTNGLSVVVAAHFVADNIVGFDGVDFNTVSGYNTEASFYNASLLANAHTAIDNFINGGGEFVCWLCGHEHDDLFGYCQNHSKQIVLLVDSAQAAEAKSSAITTSSHIVGTKSEDAFNIVGFDKHSKLIKVFRIGCEWTINMKHKVNFCINYKTKEIITSAVGSQYGGDSEQLNEIETKIKSLFGEKNYESGKYLNAAGAELDDASFAITDYITYETGKELIWRYSASGAIGGYLIMYDASKNVLSYWSSSNGSGYRILTAAEMSAYACKYVRFTFKLADISQVNMTLDGVVTYKPSAGGILEQLQAQIDALKAN